MPKIYDLVGDCTAELVVDGVILRFKEHFPCVYGARRNSAAANALLYKKKKGLTRERKPYLTAYL